MSFAGVDPEEIQQMVAGNAAKVYGFDLDFLAPLAARIGPTKAEIAEPLDCDSVPAAARKCPGFARDNQRPAVRLTQCGRFRESAGVYHRPTWERWELPSPPATT